MIFRILKQIGHYRYFVFLSVILTGVTVGLSLYLPILTGRAIDYIIGPGEVDVDGLFQILKKMGLVIAATAILQWIMNVCNNHITFHVVRDIRNQAMDRIQVLPFSYIDSHAAGDVVSRVIADADQFADGLLMGFTQLFSGVMTIVCTFVFMLSINVYVTILVATLTPISLFVARFIATRSHSMFVLQSKTRGEQTALVEEMIQGQQVVKAYGYEEKAQERFDEINGRLQEASLKATFFSSLTNPGTRFVNNLVYAGVAGLGAFLAIRFRTVTVGQLTALLSYANQYTKPFNEISSVITELQNALACAGRLFELIEEEPEVPAPADAVKLEGFDGTVDMDHVDFSYVKTTPLIEDLNLHVRAGERVAIVGPTGAGKSTLINLLMRFYDADTGEIRVSGVPVKDLVRQNLRSGFGMVLQETWLQAGTIHDNIAFGRQDATREEVVAAAKAAHAHSFIKRLPKGYDTVIGEDGGALSEGQKQLLCIARVMLDLPPMLILDEATSSIDTRTELRIQKAFTEMMKDRTSFVVAHRLSTIRESD
ncbi:MAG: ABC transporter ATP-binding protein, partial [Lachnospiraceae bacterium]|nr:ABC transporter ATP-binding protein [Lachnospiraceae bacterium]